MSQNIIIFGATSAIAEHCARRWAGEGASLLLVARDESRAAEVAMDLRVRGARRVETLQFDFCEIEALVSLVERAFEVFGSGRVGTVLIAFGTLTDQRRAEQDIAYASDEFRLNALSTCTLMTAIANRLIEQRGGRLGIISSVAGDRGRASNYVYGSAKAMVSAFSEGLRARLGRHGVSLTLIKPGFIDTPMTANFRKGFLWADPASISPRITVAIARGDRAVYVPRFWALVMWFIRAVPNRLFDRLPL
jgi:decaprenylphospho-beta-D-erythro-pentofuranosid-2-ulose 2-reductase